MCYTALFRRQKKWAAALFCAAARLRNCLKESVLFSSLKFKDILLCYTGKITVISNDFSSSVEAVILPLWAFTMAAAIDSPSP